MKKTILSASVATGNLTLGNYIGAITNWHKLQKDYNCFYMVADLHSITVPQDPKALRTRRMSFLAQYLACGLDPEKNTIFMQSHISAHAELSWVLSSMTSMGSLNRMTQFKEKSKKEEKNILAGLFTYPVLMAADILLYQTHLVPVGEDQKQHLEFTRDIAQSFNKKYGESFVVPEPYIPKVGARIMSLREPKKKMSKSDTDERNYIALLDDPKKIEKKIKASVTDSGNKVLYEEEKNPGIANLLNIYSALTGKEIKAIERDFEGKMYGHFKIAVAECICETLKPVQEKYNDYIKNKDYLEKILKTNGEKARTVANKTLQKVYERIGFL